jgi:hypothetical protein
MWLIFSQYVLLVESEASLARLIRRKRSVKCCLTLVALIVAHITSVLIVDAHAQTWMDTGRQGDWSGSDFSCTAGSAIPSASLCNAGTRGRVAVCWRTRQVGECGNANMWCTYKDITLATPPNGNNPGQIWECK